MSPRVEQLAANLWRWTTPHPLWREGDDERAGGWEQDVGSVLYARDGIVTIIDPLVTGEDDVEVWGLLDTAVRGAVAVVVALTASWHLRSAPAVAERYDAEIRLHEIAARDDALRGVARVRAFEANTEIAPGVEGLLVGGLVQGEVAYHLARARRARRGRGLLRRRGRAARRRGPRARLARRPLRLGALPRPPRPRRSSCPRTAARRPTARA